MNKYTPLNAEEKQKYIQQASEYSALRSKAFKALYQADEMSTVLPSKLEAVIGADSKLSDEDKLLAKNIQTLIVQLNNNIKNISKPLVARLDEIRPTTPNGLYVCKTCSVTSVTDFYQCELCDTKYTQEDFNKI